LSLNVGRHGILSVSLLFQLADRALLKLHFRLEFRDFFTLDFDERL